MTRYRLKAIEDTLFKSTIITDAEIPLNTPIMLVKSRYKNGQVRMGFKRLKT